MQLSSTVTMHQRNEYSLLHKPGLSASRVGGSLTLAWAARAGYVPDHVTCIRYLACQIFIIVMQCGMYPARLAQAGVRLPPTLEAHKPGTNYI